MKEVLESLIGNAKSICVLGHTRPDGDCLGSTLGWKNYIEGRFPDKEVTVFLMEANHKFAYLPGFSEIRHDVPKDEYDLASSVTAESMKGWESMGVLQKMQKSAM